MTTTQPIEVKKDGLRQCQDGTWKLSLTVHPNDMPTSLMTAPMGTRYGMALVEIGDDEQPVPSQSKPAQASTSQRKPAATRAEKARRHWDDMPRSQQAAVRVTDREWRHWAKLPDTWTADDCTDWIKESLNIQSRKELDSNPAKAAAWDRLDAKFIEDTRLPERHG